MDFPGNDITTLYSPDAEHCLMLCTQHPSCQFFSFHQANWTKDNTNFFCYLKSTPSGQPNFRTPLVGVTSGFSLKFCDPDPQPCMFKVYDNVDFFGADYQFLFTPDYEECQRACTQDPACQFFTFAKDNHYLPNIRYRCHLKFSWNIPRTPIVERRAGLISGFSQKLQIAQQFDTACEKKLFPGIDIPGSDLQMVKAASPEHCQVLCSAHPGCTFFSFLSPNFECYLKNNPNEMVTKAKAESTSGMPARFCRLDDNWVKVAYDGINFRGSDIRFELMDDANKCQEACTQEPACQFYNYIHDNTSSIWRNCYLKRVITMPSPPKINKQAGVVSGFPLRNCLNHT